MTACCLKCLPVAVMLLAAGTTAPAAEVFSWTDAHGVVHFSDYPPRDGVPARTLDIPAENPPDYDPQVQYARTETRWSQLLDRAAPEDRGVPAPAPTQVIVVEQPVDDDGNYFYSAYRHGPGHSRPPHRPHPRPPIQRPRPPDVPRALEDLERTAHPARTARRPGATERYGVLGARNPQLEPGGQ